MKKEKLLLLFILFTTLISYSQNTKESNTVIVNSEKCIEWGLPELNLVSEIPKEYKLSYNESGGFYFQEPKI